MSDDTKEPLALETDYSNKKRKYNPDPSALEHEVKDKKGMREKVQNSIKDFAPNSSFNSIRFTRRGQTKRKHTRSIENAKQLDFYFQKNDKCTH